MILRTLYYLRTLRKNQWANLKTFKEIQERRLKSIIKFAYETVPFYHRKFDGAGIKPCDIKSVEDLPRVPITTKSEIQRAPINEVVANSVDISQCVRYTTSGSTGIPLTLYFDKKSLDFDAALWTRTYLESGYKFKHKMAIIADPHSSPPKNYWYQNFGVMRKKHISIYNDVEKQISVLEQYKPDVLQSYPTSLNILTHAIRRKGTVDIQPELVFSEAEILDKVTRGLVYSAFNVEVFDLYATREFGLMAWECKAHVGYHLNVDSTVTEFVRNGVNVAPGESGEMVCTSIVNRSMPLIRYRVGDTGIPTDEKCSCGRSLPLMRALEGRVDDFLVTTDGRVVSSLILFPFPFEGVSGIKQFRAIQEKRNKILIQLVVADDFPKDANEVWKNSTAAMRKVFGKGMQTDFQILEELPRDPSGKIRKVVSHVSSGMRNL